MNDSATPGLVGSSEGLGLEPERELATWYEVSHYGTMTITPVRVLRETAHQIVLADCSPGNARRAKAGTYFQTWKDAHQYLLLLTQRELDAARMVLSRAHGRHDNVKGMRPNVGVEAPLTAQQEHANGTD